MRWSSPAGGLSQVSTERRITRRTAILTAPEKPDDHMIEAKTKEWRAKLRVLLTAFFLIALASGAAAAELLMFETEDCPWCRRWHAEIGPGYPKTEEGRRAPLRRLDIRQQAQAGAELERPVTATPTFVLVAGRREIGRLVGYPGSEFFYSLLGDLLSRLPAPDSSQRQSSSQMLPCRTDPNVLSTLIMDRPACRDPSS
jgi:hypothetical protein